MYVKRQQPGNIGSSTATGEKLQLQAAPASLCWRSDSYQVNGRKANHSDNFPAELTAAELTKLSHPNDGKLIRDTTSV